MSNGAQKTKKKETPKEKTITINLGGNFVATLPAAMMKQVPFLYKPPKNKTKKAEDKSYADLAKACGAEVYYVTTTKKGVQKWTPATDESHYAKAGKAIKSKSDVEVEKKIKKLPPAV